MDFGWLWHISVGSSVVTNVLHWAGGVGNGGGYDVWAQRAVRKSVPSSQLDCEPKTALKFCVNEKKKSLPWQHLDFITLSLAYCFHRRIVFLSLRSTLVLCWNPLLHQQHQIKRSHHLLLRTPTPVLCTETRIGKGKNLRWQMRRS